MTALLVVLYWLLATAVVYPYCGYPAVLWLLVRIRGAYQAHVRSPSDLPSITLMISAYNEAAVIDTKLRNARNLDYDHARLQILVVSDACDDGTDDIVLRHAAEDARVQLHRQAERRGKTAGINHAIELATGDLVVFSDANAIYATDALRELAAPFADPAVGYVVGAAHYKNVEDSASQDSEGLYWRYELALKELESALGSVVGGDGALYAIRRHLFWPLREDDINDLVNPLQIITAGYRGVFNPRAQCFEEGAESFAKEFKRKRRIVNRSWRATLRYGAALRRAATTTFMFQFISHKVLRWLALPLIIAVLLINLKLVMLGHRIGLYGSLLIALLTSIGLAGRGHWLAQQGREQPRPIYLLYYFYLVNLAALLGIYDEFRGVRHTKWDHVRSAAEVLSSTEKSPP